MVFHQGKDKLVGVYDTYPTNHYHRKADFAWGYILLEREEFDYLKKEKKLMLRGKYDTINFHNSPLSAMRWTSYLHRFGYLDHDYDHRNYKRAKDYVLCAIPLDIARSYGQDYDHDYGGLQKFDR